MTASLISDTRSRMFLTEEFIEDTSLADQTVAYRTLDNFDPLMGYEGRCYPPSSVRNARRVWNEAHIENDHRTALEMFLTVAPVIVPTEVEVLTELLRVANATNRELTRAANRPVLEGSDERMTEFWRKAAVAANEAGFCPEYDKLARAMGGVSREDMETEYYITMNVSTSVTMRVTLPLGTDPEGSNFSPFDYFSTGDLEQEIDTSRYDWDFSNAEIAD